MHGQKIIVFFITPVSGVLIFQIIAYQRRRGRAVMTVGDVGGRYFCKRRNDCLDAIFITNNPQPVPDTVIGHEIIFRFIHLDCGDPVIQPFLGTVCQKYGFGVHHGHSYVALAIILLIRPRQLVFPDPASQIILNRGTGHDAGLDMVVPGQFIDVETILFILEKNTLVQQFLKIFPARLVDGLAAGVDIGSKRDLGLGDP